MNRNSYGLVTRFGASLALALLCATAAQAALNISTDQTQNVSCSGGVCTATAKKAVLNVNDLTEMLAAGDATVKSGSIAQDIDINAAVSWISASRLTLDSQRSIEFKQPVAVAGSGALTITTNDGGTGGAYFFLPSGSISFWDLGSSLIINGQKFVLLGDIRSLAKKITAHPAGVFALAKSYDAAPDGTYDHAPVQTIFSGTFAGLGNSFLNVTISDLSQNENVGLFAVLAAGGTIRDLRVVSAAITSSLHSIVGGIVGDSSGTVENSFVSGSVGGTDSSGVGGMAGGMEAGAQMISDFASVDVTATGTGNGIFGGLVGYSYGSISGSSAAGSVHGSYGTEVGGLVGYNFSGGTLVGSFARSNVISTDANTSAGGLAGRNDGTIENCHATGKVLASTQGGGLVGANLGSVDRTYATGEVTGNRSLGSTNGGLVAQNGGSVSRSYSTGSVNGTSSAAIGGLIGDNSATVSDVYSLGAASGGRQDGIGGLIGVNFSQVQRAFSTGSVVSGSKHSILGGLLGYDYAGGGSIGQTYWDFDTSGISDPSQGAGNVPNDPGITGLTDTQMKSGLPDGFDPQVWGQDANINNGYPYLLANPPPKNAPAKRVAKVRPRGN